MTLLIVIVLLSLGVAVLLGASYNELRQTSARADRAWQEIDRHLRRRHDLIPNLIDVVKGHAPDERARYENVTRLRSTALAAGSIAERALAESQLGAAIHEVIALAKHTPQLSASDQFQALEASISAVEKALESHRGQYNDAVRELNRRGERFPGNALAEVAHVRKRQQFELAGARRAEA